MDNNNDLLYWKLGQMNAAKGYSAVSKGRGATIADWADSTDYVVGNRVISGSIAYVCISAHTSVTAETPDIKTDLWRLA